MVATDENGIAAPAAVADHVANRLARRQKVSWQRASAGDNIDSDSRCQIRRRRRRRFYTIRLSAERRRPTGLALLPPLLAAAPRRKSEAAATTFRATERDSIILKAFPVDERAHICADWARCGWRRRRHNLHVDTTRTCSTRR